MSGAPREQLPSPFADAPATGQAPATPAAPARASLGEAPRASVVAIMHEVGQALLWDGVRGEYVLVRAGATFQDFYVSAISAEQVVLSRGNQHFVLSRSAEAPDLSRRLPAGAAQPGQVAGELGGNPYAPVAASPQPAQAGELGGNPYGPVAAPPQPIPGITPFSAQAPVDPYASAAVQAPAAPAAQAPLDPYASAAVQAPAGQAPAFFAPDDLPPAPAQGNPYRTGPAAPPQPVAPALPSSLLESRIKPMPRASAEARSSAQPSAPVAANDTPRVTSVPRPVIQSQGEAAALRDEQHSLSRKEFDAAISDFEALGRDVQVTQTGDGVRVDEVASGSLPYRMGVRAGDVVLDVDGKKLRSMNDAAAIYARLMDVDRFAVKVRRGTGIITLRYQFTR